LSDSCNFVPHNFSNGGPNFVFQINDVPCSCLAKTFIVFMRFIFSYSIRPCLSRHKFCITTDGHSYGIRRHSQHQIATFKNKAWILIFPKWKSNLKIFFSSPEQTWSLVRTVPIMLSVCQIISICQSGEAMRVRSKIPEIVCL